MFGKLNGNTAFISTFVPYCAILCFCQTIVYKLSIDVTVVGSLDSDEQVVLDHLSSY